MAKFKEAYKVGRVNEGGYSNRAADKGGETYAGISRVNWPDWEGWCIIDTYKELHGLKQYEFIKDNPLLEELIYKFYEENFWPKIKGDLITDQQVANIFYDWTLTSGGAIRAVQRAFNVDDDGKVGKDTLKAINSTLPEQAFNLIKDTRRKYYLALNQPANIKGWLNRVKQFNYVA